MNKRLIAKNKSHMTAENIKSLKAREIEKLIRLHYSMSDELAILRQRDEKPEEFAAYHDYAEECKRAVKIAIGEEVEA